MDQQLRAFVARAEDLGSIPNTHMLAKNYFYLQFPGIQCLLLTPNTQVHIYTCMKNTHL